MTSLYSYTDEIAANTPYLIEMPGDSWGEQWSLINKPITFSAGNGAQVLGGYNIVDGLAVVDADNQNFVSTAMAYREIQRVSRYTALTILVMTLFMFLILI